MKTHNPLAKRFRGLLPIIVDVETSGLRSETDALLEIAAVTVKLNGDNKFSADQTFAYNVEPFLGARIEQESLDITGIDPYSPLRFAIPEAQALARLFHAVRAELEKSGCYRAILVGQNAWFDLSFLLAACKRAHIRYIPFHTFTTIDTATLSAVAVGETVLARAMRRVRIPFDLAQAHSAIYDAQRTAELFCAITNKWTGM